MFNSGSIKDNISSLQYLHNLYIFFKKNSMQQVEILFFFKGKLPTCQLMYGQCVVCLGGWGTQLVHPEGGTPAGPSRGGGPLPCSLPGGPLPCSLLGVHFCVHFWGVSCDLSHNALIYCYRMPQCIMGKIHMGCPPPPQRVGQTDRQTSTQRLVKTLPSHTTRWVVKMIASLVLKFLTSSK